jgi:hypothetical protein
MFGWVWLGHVMSGQVIILDSELFWVRLGLGRSGQVMILDSELCWVTLV